jgi:hypothetical protein
MQIDDNISFVYCSNANAPKVCGFGLTEDEYSQWVSVTGLITFVWFDLFRKYQIS